MYIKPKKEHKKQTKAIIITVAAVLLGLILVFVIMQIVQANQKKDANTNTNNNNSTTSQQAESNPQSTSEKTEDPKQVKQYEGEDPNSGNALTGSVTSAFLANGKFSLRVHIDQFVSNGTCSLTMTKGSQTYTASAPLVASASTSTCQGFDATEAEVGSGSWHVKINLESNGKTGTIEKEVNL